MDNEELENGAEGGWSVPLHLIPKRFIEELGATDGYVLSKLCHLQSKATFVKDGRKWFVCPLGRRATTKEASKTYQPLSDYFPWLGFKALHKIVQKLEEKKYITIGRGFNKWKKDRTLWYSVSKASMKKWYYKENRVFFNPADAKAFKNVSRAIVLNILYREFHLEGRPDNEYLTISRNKIATETGLALSSVSNIISHFEQIKLLQGFKEIGRYKLMLKDNPCNMRGRGARPKIGKLGEPIESTACESNPHGKPIERVIPKSERVEVADGAWLTIEEPRQPPTDRSLLQMIENVLLSQIESDQSMEAKKQRKIAARKKVVPRKRGKKKVDKESLVLGAKSHQQRDSWGE